MIMALFGFERTAKPQKGIISWVTSLEEEGIESEYFLDLLGGVLNSDTQQADR